MNYLICLATLLGCSIANASTGPETIVCSIEHDFDQIGNHNGDTIIANAGKMSVQDCISLALKLQLTANPLTKMTYFDYTKTTLVNGSIDVLKGSEGWSLSATISSLGTRPAQLEYKEFVNP